MSLGVPKFGEFSLPTTPRELGITVKCKLQGRAAPGILLMPHVYRYLLLAQHMHFRLTKDFHLMDHSELE